MYTNQHSALPACLLLLNICNFLRLNLDLFQNQLNAPTIEKVEKAIAVLLPTNGTYRL